jgi:hypothetical protein
MVGAVRQHAPILSVASFSAWLASRPDEEHWELIEGVPRMATPNRRHQRTASNLESLLIVALKRHNPRNIRSTCPRAFRSLFEFSNRDGNLAANADQ